MPENSSIILKNACLNVSSVMAVIWIMFCLNKNVPSLVFVLFNRKSIGSVVWRYDFLKCEKFSWRTLFIRLVRNAYLMLIGRYCHFKTHLRRNKLPSTLEWKNMVLDKKLHKYSQVVWHCARAHEFIASTSLILLKRLTMILKLNNNRNTCCEVVPTKLLLTFYHGVRHF